MTALRLYQSGCSDAFDTFWGRPPETWNAAGLAVVGTGLGKSYIAAELARRIAGKTICICPTRELVEQNERKARDVWPGAKIGIFCAGLERSDVDGDYVVATMRSLHKISPARFGKIDLIVVDEAHLVTMDGDSQIEMYRAFIAKAARRNPAIRIAGLTATPFRTRHGRIDGVVGSIFSKTIFSYGYYDGWRDGLCVPLVSKPSKTRISTKGVKIDRGEFAQTSLLARAKGRQLIRAACSEIISNGRGRGSWMVFCINREHAKIISAELTRRGVDVALLIGDGDEQSPTAKRRADVIERFRAGKLRCLVSVDMFVLGLDVPRIDLVAILRPTLSFVRYWQMKGRGVRSFDGKENCLILDFGNNARRHGLEESPAERASQYIEGDAASSHDLSWECPSCGTDNAIFRIRCIGTDAGGKQCHELRPKLHAPTAFDGDAMVGVTTMTKRVTKIRATLQDCSAPLGSKFAQIEFECVDKSTAIGKFYFDAPHTSAPHAISRETWSSLFSSATPTTSRKAVAIVPSVIFPREIEAAFAPSGIGALLGASRGRR